MSRGTRFVLALLLIAAALQLPVKAWAAAGAVAVLGWAADHTPAALLAVAALVLLRSLPGAPRAVAALAGDRASRLLAGGAR
ncbi:hypothetical protein [Streptomyces sp. NPDC001380]|uniref:hypothetical protein n=1 Tax=Streptomyces sp. NPDC001380 TaxID=3364566 RepID=UPI00367A855A